MRAIFGEKAGDVRDSSLRVPPGVQGIVISAKVFSRKCTEKDERAKDIEDAEKEKLITDQRDEVKIISDSYYNKMRRLLAGKTTAARLVDDKGKVLAAKGIKLDGPALDEVPVRYLHEIQVVEGGGKTEEKLAQLAQNGDLQALELLLERTSGAALGPIERVRSARRLARRVEKALGAGLISIAEAQKLTALVRVRRELERDNVEERLRAVEGRVLERVE